MTIQPVVLCYDGAIEQEWFLKCIRSWANLRGCSKLSVLDGGLTLQGVRRLARMGLSVFDLDESKEKVCLKLQSFPHLRRMRDEHGLFRKLVDPSAVFENAQQILLMDCDIHVCRPVTLPAASPDITYVVDDVSGYAGSWRIPSSLPMVLGLNSGFVLYSPQVVNFSLLDQLCQKYFLKMPKAGRWWAEQTAWSVLAGCAESRGVFDGQQCVIVNGAKRRTNEEIWSNKTRWFGRIGVLDQSGFSELIERARVVHFAGGGRPWIERLRELTDDETRPEVLRIVPTTVATSLEKVLLAGRMGVRQWYKEGLRRLKAISR